MVPEANCYAVVFVGIVVPLPAQPSCAGDRLAARVEQLRVGDPTRADTEVGPLIRPTEADRVETWIEEAVTGGARRIGGGRLGKTTLKPTILIDPLRDAKVSSHEIFGPVVRIRD